MIRHIAPTVVAFDAEWVPDPTTGRRVYGLPPEATDDEVRETMWAAARRADTDDPRPYLKTVLCRVVSIAAVFREPTERFGFA
jgi:hypothetical protein